MSDTPEPRALDDVLLAMDVVDTLRHRETMLSKEMDLRGREVNLIDRLREIYTAQGIEVTDAVLEEGVKALAERRFAYTPPKPGFGVRLAKIYVSRDRWLKPVAGGVVAVAAAVGVYQVGVAGPAKARAAEAQVLLEQTLPAQLATLLSEIQSATTEEAALRIAYTYHQDGVAAIADEDAKGGKAAVAALEMLKGDVVASYDIRVVYGPDEAQSGVFRIPDDVPDGRNYYLIVEAVDAAGRAVTVPVVSEEDGVSKRVSRWGQRVSEDAFYTVAADKNDDQIIQGAKIGSKPSGRLSPVYTVATPGGAILEW